MTWRRRRGLGSRRGAGPGRRGTPDSGFSSVDRGRRRRPGRRRGSGLRIPEGWAARVATTAAAVAAFFGIGYLISAAVLFPAEGGADADSLVKVPELVGLGSDEARVRVEEAGLGWTVRGSASHPEAPEGAVLAQTPLPGQLARPGAPVRVTLSRGPERRGVPEVTGLSERQARIVLERLGFRPTTREVKAMVERGRAVGTEPAAGVVLAVPADLDLLVSMGPPVALVPDLGGRHLDDVADLLAAEGLTLGRVTWDPLAAAAPGRVTGQYPPAGYSLREGGTVEVRVAGRATAGGGDRIETGGAEGRP